MSESGNSLVDSVVIPHERSPTFPWSVTDDDEVTCEPDRQVTTLELLKRVVEPGRARAINTRKPLVQL